MKIYFFLVSALFVSASLFAQNNTFPGSGNVGIGTTTPINGLHVFSNNNFNDGSIRIGYSGAEDAVLSFGWNGIDQDAFKITKFLHNSSLVGTNLFTINAINGNTGIGTATLDAKLAINGTLSMLKRSKLT